jgi:hypothetical protein
MMGFIVPISSPGERKDDDTSLPVSATRKQLPWVEFGFGFPSSILGIVSEMTAQADHLPNPFDKLQ